MIRAELSSNQPRPVLVVQKAVLVAALVRWLAVVLLTHPSQDKVWMLTSKTWLTSASSSV
jgi:hypothetical protein